MSTVDYLKGVRHGEFNALMRGVVGPAHGMRAMALEVFAASRHVEVTAAEAHLLSDLAAGLEAAAANLRKAAACQAPAPSLRLVAAE